MTNALAKAIKAALKPVSFRAANDEDENTGDQGADDSGDEDEPSAAEEEDEPEANDEDDEDVSADGQNGDEEKPDAATLNTAIRAAREEERSRCVAIFSHQNAEGSPKLAAKLLADGTSENQAVSLLDAAEGKVAANTGGSLAERVHASQGSKKPGQDVAGGKRQTGKDVEGSALVASASKNFGQKKAARNQLLNR
ncbi:MAG: hypothetical protein GY927_18345 [bacterium]|nr:hypothetical protein [bacterium]